MHLIAYINASGKHGPVFADLDPETGLVSNIKDVFDKEAEKVRRPGSAFARIETIGEYTLAVLDCGSGAETDYQFILFKNTEYVCELDTSSIKLIHSLEGFSVDETKNSLYMSGFIPRDNINMEFDLNNGKLKSQKSFNDIDTQSVNIAEYTMTDNGEMCKIDSLGNIVKIDYNTMTPKTVIDTNWYTPYFYDIQNEKYSVFSTVLNCTEDRAVILDGEVISYGCLEYIDHEYVRVLKKADKNPHAGKKIVELALPLNSGVTDYLAKAIFEFNKTDNEYLIRVWDKYKTGFVLPGVRKPASSILQYFRMSSGSNFFDLHASRRAVMLEPAGDLHRDLILLVKSSLMLKSAPDRSCPKLQIYLSLTSE